MDAGALYIAPDRHPKYYSVFNHTTGLITYDGLTAEDVMEQFQVNDLEGCIEEYGRLDVDEWVIVEQGDEYPGQPDDQEF